MNSILKNFQSISLNENKSELEQPLCGRYSQNRYTCLFKDWDSIGINEEKLLKYMNTRYIPVEETKISQFNTTGTSGEIYWKLKRRKAQEMYLREHYDMNLIKEMGHVGNPLFFDTDKKMVLMDVPQNVYSDCVLKYKIVD